MWVYGNVFMLVAGFAVHDIYIYIYFLFFRNKHTHKGEFNI